VRIVAQVSSPELRSKLDEAARRLDVEIVHLPDNDGEKAGLLSGDVLVAELSTNEEIEPHRRLARRSGAGLVLACSEGSTCDATALSRADEWLLLPASTEEIETRISIAEQRVIGAAEPRKAQEAAELLRYEELLYDRLTGFPTLAVMIERARELLDRLGEITVLYIHFVWYELKRLSTGK